MNERHFSIDPGLGKKMDGCPYSIYEDGHDVKDYIIPPKGYVFTGFRFDPEAVNQIYDGRLIAEYTKEPIKQRFKNNLWMLILAIVILVVIAVIAILAAGVFKKSSTTPPPLPKVKNTVVQPKDSIKKKEPTTTLIDSMANKGIEAQQPTEKATSVSTPVQEIQQQPVANDSNSIFKKNFWALIHQRTLMMDPYHELYTNNKGKVNGEEYDYLRFTILKDYSSFKDWSNSLKRIPEDQLQSIESLDALKSKLRN
jgi:hypothetical protein